MNNKVTYYLIWERVVGKQEDGECFIFKSGKWNPDNEFIIMDRLVGYDPSEPPGSPYRFGNGSVMDEIDEIPYEQAIELTGGLA